MDQSTLQLGRQSGVTTIALDRPQKLNALSRRMLRELQAALEAAGQDPQCRCVLLTGTGRAFSAGADLTDPEAKSAEDHRLGRALESFYHPLILTLRSLPKPVVAAVNGMAAGAGCSIALAADVTLAARSASFMLAFIRIGLVPDAGATWLIPRLIGRARAMRWMMTGEALDAEQAQRWGLISDIVDDDRLMPAALALASRLAAAPTRSLTRIRRLVDASSCNDLPAQLRLEAKAQTEAGLDDDFVEGVQAFRERRAPRFTGH